jgi:murein DD-endopeptidase MepM/ murein hydrolase activator NlpD
MLKSMGYSDPVRAEEDDFGTGNYSRRLRLALEAGSKKARSLNWKKVGAVTGTMSAVALVSLGTSLSAYAAADSDDLYQRFHTTYSDMGKPQSLKVSANAQPPAVIDRMKDIYKPDMIWPTVNGSGVFISSGFGYRSAPCSACSSNHGGLDMNPGYGTEVYSSTAGTVVSVGWSGSLGWDVTIRDEGNRVYVYGHMIEGSTPADVVVGARVAQGQVIGLVGSTGLSTGAHLHFEIHEDGVKINPYPELLKYAH